MSTPNKVVRMSDNQHIGAVEKQPTPKSKTALVVKTVAAFALLIVLLPVVAGAIQDPEVEAQAVFDKIVAEIKATESERDAVVQKYDEDLELLRSNRAEAEFRLGVTKLNKLGKKVYADLTPEDKSTINRLEEKVGQKKLVAQPASPQPIPITFSEPEQKKDLSKQDHLWEACGKHAKNQETCYRIMTGVFVADSSWATAGAGKRNNNPGNMRPGSGAKHDPDAKWVAVPSPGNGYFRKYETLEGGIYDNVALYAKHYEGMSIKDMQRVWARAGDHWGNTVRQYLNQ